jgi:glycosyltransferase involved in cell wall biosynthesis
MIIYAVNVHTGGGKVLLDELIAYNTFGPVTHLFVDSRYKNPLLASGNIRVTLVAPNILARFRAEKQMQEIAAQSPQEEVLFFGNLPPLQPIKNKAILYLQSCFLLARVPMPKDSRKLYLRTLFERLWLRLGIKNINEVWVQTKWMQELVRSQFPSVKVAVKPFCPTLPKIEQVEKLFDFISVTSFSRHKNLPTLMNALTLLDEQLSTPVNFLLVLDGENRLSPTQVFGFKNINLNVETKVTRDQLAKLYAQTKTCIVTSSLESFCLPLYEAAFYKLNILAYDTPFARECEGVTAFYKTNSPAGLAAALKKAAIASWN